MHDIGISLYETPVFSFTEIPVDTFQIKDHILYNIEKNKKNQIIFDECCDFFNKLNKKIDSNKTLIIFTGNDRTNPENLIGKKFNVMQSWHKRKCNIITNAKNLPAVTSDSYKKNKDETTLCFVLLKSKKTKIEEFDSKYCDFGIKIFFKDLQAISLALNAFYKIITHRNYEYSYENSGFMFKHSNITYSDWYDWFYKGDSNES